MMEDLPINLIYKTHCYKEIKLNKDLLNTMTVKLEINKGWAERTEYEAALINYSSILSRKIIQSETWRRKFKSSFTVCLQLNEIYRTVFI